MEELLQVKNLKTCFNTDKGILTAVDDVSFNIGKGEMIGLVGESGSGKSVTSLSIIKLINLPGYIADGKIIYKGIDILKLNEKEMLRIRGSEINMIFQKPIASINPVFSIGYQMIESIRTHDSMSRKEAENLSIELLENVGITDAKNRLKGYAHQFSGGMCQRIMIAIALSCNPMLLIADEPTTALDVTIQAQVLNILKKINKDYSMSVLLITHNLGLVFESCSKTMVMYAGQLVEQAGTIEIYNNPMHPYTEALLECIPKVESDKDIVPLEGKMPELTERIKGCRFAPRCKYRMDICSNTDPQNVNISSRHIVRCLKYL